MRSAVLRTSLTSLSVLPFLRIRRAQRRIGLAMQVVARNRILLTPSELEDGDTVRLPAHDSRTTHILQILKLMPGDKVKIGIINGVMGQARIAQTSPIMILECQHWVQPLPTAQVYLVLAMPRPKVMRRLWSILACLGITRVYITGAKKVEKAYFGARILEPRDFMKELIIGAEQAGDTRLPAVFFSRSLKATIASLPSTSATDTATLHKSDDGQVQTLLPEGATEWNVVQSKLRASAVQRQGDSISCRGKAAIPARRVADPLESSLGLLSHGDSSQSGAKAAAAVQDNGSNQAGSTACVAAETGNGQAAAMATADGCSGSSADHDCGVPHVVRLLAHTEGGISVQQAVVNHFCQCAQSKSIAGGLSDDMSDHIGVAQAGQLQVTGPEPSTTAADVDGQLQDSRQEPVAVLAIGPEGGWTPSEIALLKENAFQTVTAAGGRTLDTSTALISLLCLVGEAMIEYNDKQTC